MRQPGRPTCLQGAVSPSSGRSHTLTPPFITALSPCEPQHWLEAWSKGSSTWQVGLDARASVNLMEGCAPSMGMAAQHLSQKEMRRGLRLQDKPASAQGRGQRPDSDLPTAVWSALEELGLAGKPPTPTLHIKEGHHSRHHSSL